MTNGNTDKNPESFSNRLYFDVEKMCVYGYTRELTKYDWYGGWGYDEKRILIRDLASNKSGDAANSPVIADRWWGKFGTLAAADFAAGYTVKVTMEDVTANDTVLNAATADATETQTTTVYGDNVKVKKVGDAFDRTGKMIIYSVNGQDMRVNRGFNAPTTFNYTFPTANTPYTGVAATGYRFEAKEQNANAEGNSFSLDPIGFITGNAFTMALAPQAKNYAAVLGTEWEFKQGYRNDGLSTKTYEYDPYSDVLELGVTFRSETDPTKAFTVYLASRETMRNKVTVRVGVEGESYRNDGGLKGYGDNGLQAYAGSLSAGTFGNFANSSNDSYNAKTNPYCMIKFDASNMTVSTLAYGEAVSRNLTNALGARTKTLAAADFTGGYNVSVSVERMNRKENLGLATMHTINGNPADNTLQTGYTAGADGVHVLNEGYDRKCIIDVIKFTGNKQVSEAEVSDYAGATPYDGGRKYFDIGDKTAYAYAGTPIALPVKWGDLGAGEAISQISCKHADDDSATSLSVTNGNASFTPTKPGKYTFTANDGTKEHRAVLDITTATPLSAMLASGVQSTVHLTENEALPAVANSDIVVTSCWQSSISVSYTKDEQAFDYTAGSAAAAGVYQVTYTVTNAANETATVTRKIIVAVPDTTPPTITWTDKPEHLDAGDTFTLDAITVTDEMDEDVTLTFESASFMPCGEEARALDYDEGLSLPNEDGVLTLNVSATDSSNNSAERTFTVRVYTGNAPTVAFADGVQAEITAQESDAFTVSESDVTVSSKWDYTVSVSVTLNGRMYTYEDGQKLSVGIYEITYTVTDEYEKTASVTRKIIAVGKDTVKPELSWANKPAYIESGKTLDISGITASDDRDGNVSIVVESVTFTPEGGEARAVDYGNGIAAPSENGTLTIKVSAIDSAGNKADKTFDVLVVTEKPATGDEEQPAPAPEKKGCGSTVVGASAWGMAGILLLAFVAVLFTKRSKTENK